MQRAPAGLGKGVGGKPYSRLCNARRPRLEPGTFRSQAVKLYRLHQARPSICEPEDVWKKKNMANFYYFFQKQEKYQATSGY